MHNDFQNNSKIIPYVLRISALLIFLNRVLMTEAVTVLKRSTWLHLAPLGVSKTVISRLWNRATTGIQGRFIRNQTLRNRSQRANQIAVIRLLVSTLRVRRLEIVFMQFIFVLDGPEL